MGHSLKRGLQSVECGFAEERVRARADCAVLELEAGRDSGGRGVRTRRALTKFSNQLCFGFRIPKLVGGPATSLQSETLFGHCVGLALVETLHSSIKRLCAFAHFPIRR